MILSLYKSFDFLNNHVYETVPLCHCTLAKRKLKVDKVKILSHGVAALSAFGIEQGTGKAQITLC